jgi:hypothetical protein
MPDAIASNANLESVIAASIKSATEDPVETSPDEPGVVDPQEAPVEEPAKEAPISEGQTEPIVESPAEDKTVAPKKDEPAKPEEEDLDNIPAKEKNGRENRLPHSRVVKITANAVTKATAPLQAEIEKSKGTLERIAKVENIMFNNQAQFLEMLKQIPGYAELLTPKATETVVKPAEAEFKMPAPDVTNEKGEAVGYSLEGLQNVVKFAVDQATAQATRETETRLGKRLEPFETQAKTAREQAAFETSFQREYEATMAEANTWPLFKEHQDAILAALVTDSKAAQAAGRRPTLTLESAYRKVVLPKLTTDRTKMRAELLAEIAGKPTSTSVVKKEPAAVSSKDQEDQPADLLKVITDAVAASRGV